MQDNTQAPPGQLDWRPFHTELGRLLAVGEPTTRAEVEAYFQIAAAVWLGTDESPAPEGRS